MIHVGLKYGPLAVLRFEPVRQPGLADLAGVGLRAIEEGAADELLGDGAAALDDSPAAEVGDHGTEDAAAINAVVLIEAAILGGDHGGHQRVRHLLERHRYAVLLVERRDESVFGIVDQR